MLKPGAARRKTIEASLSTTRSCVTRHPASRVYLDIVVRGLVRHDHKIQARAGIAAPLPGSGPFGILLML
jgi:hypothetical protein